MPQFKLFSASLLTAFALSNSAFAQSAPPAQLPAQTPQLYVAPPEVIAKIKDEGLNHSQLMTTLTYLTETFGPRLTGTPNLKSANEWTRAVMNGRGMKAHLEAWGPFGRGWTLKGFSAQMERPYFMPLIAYPKAWTPSTPGAVTGEVVLFDAKSEADLPRYAGKLRGKIVLSGESRDLKSAFEPLAERRTEQSLAEMETTPAPAPTPTPTAEIALQRLTWTANRLNFLKREGAALLLDNSSAGSNGTVFVTGAAVPQDIPKVAADALKRNALQPYDKKSAPRMMPQMTLSSEHFNRLKRLVTMGDRPVVRVEISGQFYDQAPMAYNAIAEIPGTDLGDEVVMLGGHLDSWHGSTGATDNACNIAVVMEAARIIQTLGIKPRRTIRVALWSGEEQGLLGSTAYVKAHFGEMKPGDGSEKSRLTKGPEYETLSAYYNLDGGSGKIRGVFAQGNAAAMPIFEAWLRPFAALGAGTVTLRNTGSTDHISFDRVGLPGFQFIQDGLDYRTQTHHSTQDSIERVVEDDVKFNAVVMAAFVFQTAMMDEKMPRKELN